MITDENEKTLLIKDASLIYTQSPLGILSDTSILLHGNKILQIGNIDKNIHIDSVINAKNKIVYPGFINLHHHYFQAGLRGMVELQNQPIKKWIETVVTFMGKADDEFVELSAMVNMAELLLYGCTTSSDMMYLHIPKKNFFEAVIKASRNMKIRSEIFRGSVGTQSDFPDFAIETTKQIVDNSESMIRKYHNESAFSMLRIGIAPCTPYTNSFDDYKASEQLAKKYNVNLQTHFLESKDERGFFKEKYSMTPIEFLQNAGWASEKVSLVHGIYLSKSEILKLKKFGINVVTCPTSNARASLGEKGIAPVTEMLNAKINVAIGIDGSAGQDASNMPTEMRWTRTMQGVRKESTYLKPETVLEMATINGAKALRRENELGSIEVGKAADIAIFNIEDSVENAGSVHNPVSAILSNHARRAETVIVNGEILVENGFLTQIDENELVHNLNTKIKYLLNL